VLGAGLCEPLQKRGDAETETSWKLLPCLVCSAPGFTSTKTTGLFPWGPCLQANPVVRAPRHLAALDAWEWGADHRSPPRLSCSWRSPSVSACSCPTQQRTTPDLLFPLIRFRTSRLDQPVNTVTQGSEGPAAGPGMT
jgi:hypothetical protein